MRHRSAAITLATLLALAAPAAPAAAHEERKVGPITYVVGYGIEEPAAIQGQPNSITVNVTQGGKPVRYTEAEAKLLKAHVFIGDQPKPDPKAPGNTPLDVGPMEATWDTPGQYHSQPFEFTRAGVFTVHLHTDKPLRGAKVNQVFVGKEGNFGPMLAASTLQWPDKPPTAMQLAAKDAAVDAQVAELTDQADTAGRLLLGMGVVAALALILATLALVRGRNRTRVPDSPAELTEGVRQ